MEAPASTAPTRTMPEACVALKSPVVVIAPPLSVGLPVPKTMEEKLAPFWRFNVPALKVSVPP